MNRRAGARLCVTVGGTTMAELRRARDEVVDADLVELRLDATCDPDPAGALDGRRHPVIVTCRPRWEGGQFAGSEDERQALLWRAWELGADYVDLEHAAHFAPSLLAKTGGQRVVLSLHDFGGVPHDLAARVTAMCDAGAEVVKVAVMTARLTDALEVFRLGRRFAGRPFVAIGIGTPGLATRVLAARVGSCWTYAGSAWAPGQIPAARLCDEFRFRSLTPDTAVYGVVGRPIAHSVSPAMHNAAFGAEGVDAVYLPLEAADADDVLAFADALDLQGASVTAPFKVDLAARVPLDDEARAVGALNTLVRDGAGWRGTNTDLHGLMAPLRSRLAPGRTRAAVLGGGGAARAAACALRREGAHVTVHARRRGQADAVAAALGVSAADWPPTRGSWDLLVNATPVGTAPLVDDTPWPDAHFDGRLVYDLVYNPRETRLLREAAAAGCETLGGLEMLVAQAQRQFLLWTGRLPDAGVMRAAAERALTRGLVAGGDNVRVDTAGTDVTAAGGTESGATTGYEALSSSGGRRVNPSCD
jgi:3-dehydroquinate dehydratase / shikimate dehydrogenase